MKEIVKQNKCDGVRVSRHHSTKLYMSSEGKPQYCMGE
jgi:hypothetical protein